MLNQEKITLKCFDNTLQNSFSITIKVGDKYKDEQGFVWKCENISCGHIIFVQDIKINYEDHWWVPSSERQKPSMIMDFETTKKILQCPVRNWKKTNKETKTIKYG